MKKFILALALAIVMSLGLTAGTTAPAAAADQYGTAWKVSDGASMFWGPYTQITMNRSSSLKAARAIIDASKAKAGAEAFCAVLIYPWAIAACITVVAMHFASAKDEARKVKNGGTGDCMGLRIYGNSNVWPYAKPVSRVNCYFPIKCCSPGGGGGSWKHVARLGGESGGGSW